MLKHIHIRNFALAENLAIDFNPGLNIITGETGAGKSILVGAISAVLGGRVYTEVVRTGADRATVEAIFDIRNLPRIRKILSEKGLEENSELFIRREIYLKGNSRAFINDTPVTAGTVAEIGDHLIDIHGQNQHQSLLRRETHRFFLDAFGQLATPLQETAEKYRELQAALRRLRELTDLQKELDEKYELYRFQSEEISKAALQPGEDIKLAAERKLLQNTEKIFSLSRAFDQLVNGAEETNFQARMGQALHLLRELAEFSPSLENIAREFASAKIVVEESSRSVEEFQNTLEHDPARLEEIEQRLAEISSLKKKYGNSIEAILEYYEKVTSELQLRENFEFELGKLQSACQNATEIYSRSALALSKARKKIAKKLESLVIDHLHTIGMPKTRFRVNLDWVVDPAGSFLFEQKNYLADENGADQVEFYISPNPGEDFKPLARIASGGEISRIMLALKNILAEVDRIPLLIFDEIDSGVSGQIALAVGRSIGNLAGSHQIICITHLPQIASFGNSHFRVEKFVQNGRTFTRVDLLSADQRIEEIARLMGGREMSPEILQGAQQLIREAGDSVR